MIQVIKEPIVTEKNAVLNEMGIYVFKVDLRSSKLDIKAAVEKNFGVKVQRITTAICRGRSKANKFGHTKVPYWKKAMVKLKEGEKISLFEGV